MQVFDPDHKPRPSTEAVKVERDPCPCSHDWDLPQGCQRLGSRGQAGWDITLCLTPAQLTFCIN